MQQQARRCSGGRHCGVQYATPQSISVSSLSWPGRSHRSALGHFQDSSTQARRTAACSASSTIAGSLASGQLRTAAQEPPADSSWQAQSDPLVGAAHRCRSYAELQALLRSEPHQCSCQVLAAVLYRACGLLRRSPRWHAASAQLQQLLASCLSHLQQLDGQISLGSLGSVLVSSGIILARVSQSDDSKQQDGQPGIGSTAGRGARAHGAAAAFTSATTADVAQPVNGSSKPTVAARAMLQLPASRGLDQLLDAVGPQLQLQQLFEAAAPRLHTATAPQLVQICYGLASLPLQPSNAARVQLVKATFAALAVEVSAGSMAQGRTLTSKQYTLLLWSVAKMGLAVPSTWLETWWAAAKQLLHTFNIQDISNALWALTTAGQLLPAGLVPALQQRLAQLVSAQPEQLTPYSISNVLWGLAKLAPRTQQLQLQGHECSSLVRACLQQATGQCQDFDRQQLANTVWAVAKLFASSSSCGSSSSSNSSSGGHSVTTGLTSSPAWSSCRPLVYSLLQGSQHLLSSLQPVDWANIMWGLGVLRLPPPAAWLQQLYSQRPGQQQSQCWTPAVLSNLARGCAQLALQPPEQWWHAWESTTASCLVNASQTLTGCSHQEAANMVWALGVLRRSPSVHWWDSFLVATSAVPAAAAAGDSAASGAPAEAGYTGRAAGACSDSVAKQELQHTAMILQAAARLQYLLPRSWLEAAMAALAAALRNDRTASSSSSRGSPLHAQVVVMAADGLAGQLLLVSSAVCSSSSGQSAEVQPQQQVHLQGLLRQCQQWLLQHLHNLSTPELLFLLQQVSAGLPAASSSNGSIASNSYSSSSTTTTNVSSSSLDRHYVSNSPQGVLSPVQQLVVGYCWRHLSRSSLNHVSSLLSCVLPVYQQQRQLRTDRHKQQFWADQEAAVSMAYLHEQLAQQQHKKHQDHEQEVVSSSSSFSEVSSSVSAPGDGTLREILQQAAAVAASGVATASPLLAQLESLLFQQGTSLPARQLATVLDLLCQVRPASYSLSPAALAACATATAQLSATCRPQALARLLYCLGMLGYRVRQDSSSAWLEGMAEVTYRQMPGCNAANLVRMLVGMVQVADGQVHDLWAHSWCEEALQHLRGCSMPQLAAIAAALQQVQHQPHGRWLQVFGAACLQHITAGNASPAQLAAVCCFMVKARVDPGQAWCSAVAVAAAQRARSLELYQLGVLAAALAQLGFKVPRKLRIRCLSGVQPRLATATQPQLEQCLQLLTAAGWKVHSNWLGAARQEDLLVSSK